MYDKRTMNIEKQPLKIDTTLEEVISQFEKLITNSNGSIVNGNFTSAWVSQYLHLTEGESESLQLERILTKVNASEIEVLICKDCFEIYEVKPTGTRQIEKRGELLHTLPIKNKNIRQVRGHENYSILCSVDCLLGVIRYTKHLTNGKQIKGVSEMISLCYEHKSRQNGSVLHVWSAIGGTDSYPNLARYQLSYTDGNKVQKWSQFRLRGGN